MTVSLALLQKIEGSVIRSLLLSLAQWILESWLFGSWQWFWINRSQQKEVIICHFSQTIKCVKKEKNSWIAETAKKRARKLTCFKDVFLKKKITPNIKLLCYYLVLSWHWQRDSFLKQGKCITYCQNLTGLIDRSVAHSIITPYFNPVFNDWSSERT